ncbi:hypothetical protein [Oleiharenicola sp. Vm1]|uniref:hypothetical protein n=1 Tax=Oleiharenicola sp. Vm1 TaxID=3398393 RepID=UPI0039F4FC11
MSSLVGFIREFKRLGLPEDSALADLFERIMQSLLDAEGPPAEPIAGISTAVQTAIARTPKGRPMFLCHTWETGSWTCLLLDLPPVVMGRPVFLPNPAGRGLPRVVTDYRSQKFQRRIGAACHALGLPPPPEPCRVCSRLSPTRVFLAWAPIEVAPPALVGDLDNYAKNVLDALQRARIVVNDRTIAAIAFSRADLPAPAQTLDQHLLADLLKVRAEHPKLNRRALAKKAGLSQRTVKRLLKVAEEEAARPKASADEQAPASPSEPVQSAAVTPIAPRRQSRKPRPRRRPRQAVRGPILIPAATSPMPAIAPAAPDQSPVPPASN